MYFVFGNVSLRKFDCLSVFSTLMADEKRRLDARIHALEEELKEEKRNSEILMDRIEQLTTGILSHSLCGNLILFRIEKEAR